MTGSLTNLKYLLFCATLSIIGCGGEQKQTKKSNNGAAVDTSDEEKLAQKKIEADQAEKEAK